MRTFTYDLDTAEYLPPIAHAYVWLKAHPLTEALAAEVLPLRDEWKVVLLKEVQLKESLAEADARILLSDFDLDLLFNAIVNGLMTVVNNDRTSPLIVRFLGSDRPFEVRGLALFEQLQRMRTWPPGLATVASAEVKAKGAELAAFVPKADEVIKNQSTADQELTDFTEIGERKAFVDHMNATFKLLYGKTSELMHTPAGASLPPDFPDRCFPAETRSRGPTIKSEESTIKRLKDQLAKHEAILAGLKEKQETSKKAREEAEKATIQEEAAALKKDAEAKLARAAELEAKLKKATPEG